MQRYQRRLRGLRGLIASVIMITALIATFGARQASAAVPPSFAATIAPGGSATTSAAVTLPAVTPSLDLYLIVDLSGSYSDDVNTIRSLAPGLVGSVRELVPDTNFGLGSFVDFPFSPWGDSSYGDYAYQRNQDLTSDQDTWTNAVNAMVVRYGVDEPESQYEALYQAASGAGRDLNADGDYADLGEIAPSQSASFRPGASRVIAITTDASFHNSATDPSYPGASRDTTVAALNAANIRVIAIRAPRSGTEMDDIAAATGGVVVTTGSSSSEIATAITSGIAALTYDVTAAPVGCGPLNVAFAPASFSNVAGGSTVTFGETITVPAGVTAADLPPGGVVNCSVEFSANDAVIDSQALAITVPLAGPCTGLAPLDNFERANGKLGPNWAGATSTGSYRIVNKTAYADAGGLALWKPASFGSDQIACATLSSITAKGRHHTIALKAQGTDFGKGVILVSYDDKLKSVTVEYRDVPNYKWVSAGSWSKTMVVGDELSARALPNGDLQVFVNDVLVGTTNTGTFYSSKGGYIGVFYDSTRAYFDNFGGGSITP